MQLHDTPRYGLNYRVPFSYFYCFSFGFIIVLFKSKSSDLLFNKILFSSSTSWLNYCPSKLKFSSCSKLKPKSWVAFLKCLLVSILYYGSNDLLAPIKFNIICDKVWLVDNCSMFELKSFNFYNKNVWLTNFYLLELFNKCPRLWTSISNFGKASVVNIL